MKIKYRTQINLYLILFLFNIIVGSISIRGGINKIKTKLEVQKEYQKALANFDQKEKLVANLLSNIDEHKTEIEKLNEAIPNRIQEERYLVDLSLQAARAGYELKGFSITKISNTETEVMARFDGNIESVNKLTDTMNSMQRINRIESITARREREDVVIIAKITIFNYAGEQR